MKCNVCGIKLFDGEFDTCITCLHWYKYLRLKLIDTADSIARLVQKVGR